MSIGCSYPRYTHSEQRKMSEFWGVSGILMNMPKIKIRERMNFLLLYYKTDQMMTYKNTHIYICTLLYFELILFSAHTFTIYL